jgi:hypothetical protein
MKIEFLDNGKIEYFRENASSEIDITKVISELEALQGS